ncbi:MAG TPA: putative quinol monooxygenase [Bryobacteraceae bacterium]|nr:putative quinol monooxygenase [Bryobacteraceae bacterium]
MSFHFIVRFETIPGKETAFRQTLLHVVPFSRAEPGCVNIHVYESLHEPTQFAIHSEWADETAFERHVEMPYTVRFVEEAEKLLTHRIQGLRSREIA